MLQILISLVLAIPAAFSAADRVSPKAALAQVNAQNAIVVDVRENSEIKSGKIQGAQVFSAKQVGTPAWDTFVASLPMDKEIYTYCRKGKRADKVAEALRARGFKASSTGGFNDWIAAGAKSN
jgi:rhodanese-related sulfurtransferase